MKCVCPMGGDRTCPDDCPISVWWSLPPDQRKPNLRKATSERLYQQGYTQEQIATQLGVSQSTIRDDLATLVETTNVKGQGRDTLGRKKSTGRRKNKRPDISAKHEKIVQLADAGVKTQQIANEVGVGQRMVDRVLEVENARRNAEPEITPDMLSMTAQQKLDAAMRQHQHKLNAQFEQRVRDDVKRRIDEIVLPHWKEQIKEAQRLYNHRKGIMDKETFDAIRRALHPDSRRAISDKKLHEAFVLFMGLEKRLLAEKDSPTTFHDVPSDLAEWDKWRREADTARKARRGHANVARR